MPNYKKLLLRFSALAVLLVLILSGCELGGRRNPVYEGGSSNTSSKKNNSSESKSSESSTSSSNKNNSSAKKRVAITYDDGPHNVQTQKIVDELAKYNAHATFFVVGNRVDGTAYSGRSAMKYALDKGNEVGIHAYTHEKYYNKCSDADYNTELSKTLAAIQSAAPSYKVKYMRPVGGHITDDRVSSCKYSVIMWSIDSEDWKHKYKDSDTAAQKKEKVDTIVNNVMSGVQDGSIILMHDIYGSTYDATVIILKKLYDQGYEVVTVSELLGSNVSSGRKYYSLSK